RRPAARARKGAFPLAHHSERPPAASPAKFHAFGKPRTALHTRHDPGHQAAHSGAAALRRRWLACLAAVGSKLRLDHLFVTAGPDLDDPLIVPFARLCDAEYVLACRDISQHNPPRGADASLSLVVDIDLGSLRGHYYKLRVT